MIIKIGIFDDQKRGTSCPKWGEGGEEVIQAMPERKYSFFQEVFPYQCDYASIQAGDLREHLKTHSGEKSYNCNQCNFASLQASNLKTHWKIAQCSQSNFASFCAGI